MLNTIGTLISRIISRSLPIPLSLLFLTANAGATSVQVSGNISGTWSADTIIVSSDITLPAGNYLKILPGTKIFFSNGTRFIVEGIIEAVGTPADSIIFTAAGGPESYWRGIRFQNSGNKSVLQYCIIEKAKGSGQYPDVRGGGIWIMNSSPSIKNCIIRNNYSGNSSLNGIGGGIAIDGGSESIIENNFIHGNYADFGGGIYIGFDNNVIIRNNVIKDNQSYSGGGIYVSKNSGSEIAFNKITGNSSYGSSFGGGGICLYDQLVTGGASPTKVHHNLIAFNTAQYYGGGIYSRYDESTLYNNTIAFNTASKGGGIYVINNGFTPSYAINMLVYENSAQAGNEVYFEPSTGSYLSITYSDIKDGWPGYGNINADPMFIETEQNDFRLSWGSPCIDAGEIAPFYNDPDGTRSDIGCFYFDQSSPLHVFSSPALNSLSLPHQGGLLDVVNFITNISDEVMFVSVQSSIIDVDDNLPTLNSESITFTIEPGETEIYPTQTEISENLERGDYYFVLNCNAGGISAQDKFKFYKSGEDILPPGTITSADMTVKEENKDILFGNYPNPFNPVTMIRFSLTEDSNVRLTVYNSIGEEVRVLINDRLSAGEHEVLFNASQLSSGIYFYNLTTENFSETGKMILMR
ncbi:MAG: hypothetical protein Kow0098_21370 [Ignavibacteriaceae bacterium]